MRQLITAVSVLGCAGALLTTPGQRPGLGAAVTTLAAECNEATVTALKTNFRRLAAMRRMDADSVSGDAFAKASLAYVTAAQACAPADALGQGQPIDDGPLTMGPDNGVANRNLFGTKWGANSPFDASGYDNDGPHTPGGVVTYSYMGDGLDMSTDIGNPGLSVALVSLPTYQPCFRTEIADAFAAWSAVANIQFREVADNALPFNAAGASGDIRIAAHSGVGNLAHTYMPPPQGRSAAGDIHFDRNTSWSCTSTSGTADIGLVALHEIGHAIGLLDEDRSRLAVMNRYFSNSTTLNATLLADDINGVVSIYGSATGSPNSLLINFGPGGTWLYDYGRAWRQVHPWGAQITKVGDFDGNGRDDIAFAFGPGQGIWLYENAASWRQFDAGSSPQAMAVGDFDGSGASDLAVAASSVSVFVHYNAAANQSSLQAPPAPLSALDVAPRSSPSYRYDALLATIPGLGLWESRGLYNSWQAVMDVAPLAVASGWLDSGSDPRDSIFAFPGRGLYRYDNEARWTGVHPLAPVRLAVGDLDANPIDDVVVDFGAGVGVWIYRNGATLTPLHNLTTRAITLVDLDNNGRDEVAIDFGPGAGLWLYVNSSSWLQLNPTSASELFGVNIK